MHIQSHVDAGPAATVRARVVAAHTVDDPPPFAAASVVAVAGILTSAAATTGDLQVDWVPGRCVLAKVAAEACAPRPCTPPSPLGISGTSLSLVTLIDRPGHVFFETN